jgi:tripartite-type tricarboxylate transporter receptor subunit TctC
MRRSLLSLACAISMGWIATSASSQSPAEFYKGKTIDLYVGFTVGGGYDVYARLLSRHIGKHIPGSPTVVVKNMEGAGSIRLANWLYNVAPKDGTALGTFARGIPFDPLLGNPGPQFTDGSKFSFIGSANSESSVCIAWHTAGFKTVEDMKNKEFIVGGISSANESDQHPKVLNVVLGTRTKLVTGYPGGNDVTLAMERGEVQGRCGWSWTSVKTSHSNWLKDGTIMVLIQNALEKHPDLPNTPLVMDLAATEEQKQTLRLVFAPQKMGRPYVAPPGIPPDRLAALRTAFNATMNDPDFLAEAEKSKLEISPITGEEVEAIVREAYTIPKELALKTGALMR